MPSGDLRDDGSLAGTLRVHGSDPEWAEARVQRLDHALRTLPFLEELTLETEARAVGERVEIDFRIENLTDALSLVENL